MTCSSVHDMFLGVAGAHGTFELGSVHSTGRCSCSWLGLPTERRVLSVSDCPTEVNTVVHTVVNLSKHVHQFHQMPLLYSFLLTSYNLQSDFLLRAHFQSHEVHLQPFCFALLLRSLWPRGHAATLRRPSQSESGASRQ